MLAPNTSLQNRYQILRLLGQGGMGAVYLAFDHRLNQNIALKENTGGDARQFQAEAELLARLRHNNLPRVIDHFIEPNGSQYLVMDYIEGEDLETLRQTRGALPEAQVRAWFDQILDAVTYLHSQGIIHRDIKPDNIKITPTGQAVLVDFGIAKIFQAGQYTRTSQKFGSPGYASPEHYHGGTNQQSDIYSLGATLYAVLTGSPPPDAQSLEKGTAILVPPRNINPAISPQMEQVILRAMQIPLNTRWAAIQEVKDALARLAPTIPIAKNPAVQKNTWIAALGAIILMLCLFGGGLVWAFSNSQMIAIAAPTATQAIGRARDTLPPKPILSPTVRPSPTVVASGTPQPFTTRILTPAITPTKILPTKTIQSAASSTPKLTIMPTKNPLPTNTEQVEFIKTPLSSATPSFQLVELRDHLVLFGEAQPVKKNRIGYLTKGGKFLISEGQLDSQVGTRLVKIKVEVLSYDFADGKIQNDLGANYHMILMSTDVGMGGQMDQVWPAEYIGPGRSRSVVVNIQCWVEERVLRME